MSKRSELATKLLLAAGAAGGGGAFVVGRLAVATTPPATLASLRYLLALALFAALLLGSGKERDRIARPTRQDALRIAGMGLAVVAGYNLLFLQGLRMAPAADGGLIVPGSAPTFTIALGAVFLNERPTKRQLAGSLIAAAGIALIFTAAGGINASDPKRLEGDLLYLAGGSMWGVFNVLARGLHGRISPLLANTYAAAVGLPIIVAVALLTERPALLNQPSTATWLEAGYLAVFATVLLLWANVRGVERLGVVKAAPFAYVAPIAAVAGSALFLGEHLEIAILLGGAIALAGTWLATTRTSTQKRAQQEPKAA